jgi:NAD(P)-dependent dehydrogenase (short-subunit alcohol dehydrogenase family)
VRIDVAALRDKVLIVTGGSRGIGAAVARLAAVTREYAVAIIYRQEAAKAAALVAEIERSGGTAKAFAADVSDSGAVDHAFGEIDRTLGAPAALVNSAGLTGGARSFLAIEPQTLHAVTATNLFGTFYCIQSAARRMARSHGGAGGAIVNISSEAGRFGGMKLSAYAAAKAAVNTLTVALARELAEEGIRVNAVSPGVINTDQHAERSPENLAALVSSIPLQRMGEAEEVAKAVMWLLSEEASFVTGSILSINGGR